MATEEQERTALSVLKKKHRIKWLTLDSIDRVEVIYAVGQYFTNRLCWSVGDSVEWIDAKDEREKARVKIEKYSDLELPALRAVLRTSSLGHDITFSRNTHKTEVLVPRWTTLENLLVEKDLEMAEE